MLHKTLFPNAAFVYSSVQNAMKCNHPQTEKYTEKFYKEILFGNENKIQVKNLTCTINFSAMAINQKDDYFTKFDHPSAIEFNALQSSDTHQRVQSLKLLRSYDDNRQNID